VAESCTLTLRIIIFTMHCKVCDTPRFRHGTPVQMAMKALDILELLRARCCRRTRQRERLTHGKTYVAITPCSRQSSMCDSKSLSCFYHSKSEILLVIEVFTSCLRSSSSFFPSRPFPFFSLSLLRSFSFLSFLRFCFFTESG
jgi:hypothetical protein